MASKIHTPNIGELLEDFIAQFEEDDIKEEYNMILYFDTYDVIKMLQGINAFAIDNYIFDYDKFEKLDSVLVHSFAFENMLGSIHMLPPHRDELGEQLNTKLLFPASGSKGLRSITENFLAQMQIPNSLTAPENSEELIEYIKSLNIENIFKANYLLSRVGWLERLKHLHSQKTLIIDDEDYQLDKIINDPKFIQIRHVINDVRSLPKYKKNNMVDAIALFLLQEKLEKFEKDRQNNPLPVLYASSSGIVDAANRLRKGNDKFFSYQLKNGTKLSIVRASTYQTIDLVFDKKKNSDDEQLHDIFNKIKQNYVEIRQEISRKFKEKDMIKIPQSKLEEAVREFENDIVKLIHNKITDTIWRQTSGLSDLTKALRNRITLSEEAEETYSQAIDAEYKQLLNEIRIFVPKSQFFFGLLREIPNMENSVKLIFDQMTSDVDAFRDLGLLRFGITKENFNKIQTTFDEILHIVQEDQKDQLNLAIGRIVSFLSEPSSNVDFLNNLLSGLAILWILEKYSLIDKVCTYYKNDFPDEYPTYHFALMHAASLSMTGRMDANRAEAILDRLDDAKIENYFVWICKGFIKFKIWQLKTDYDRVPELLSDESWANIANDKDYYFAEQAIEYALKTVQYLEPRREEYASKVEKRCLVHLYALNNFIYYTTKAASRERFDSIKEMFATFKGMEHIHINLWQGRFYDTIGWYYFRLSIISDNIEEKTIWLQQADYYNKKAIEKVKTPRDERIFRTLNEMIREQLIQIKSRL